MKFTNAMLFLSIICPLTRAAQDYIPVSVCPPGAREWQIEAGRKKCQQPTPDYLCAAIENWPGHFGSICTQFGLSPSGITNENKLYIECTCIKISLLVEIIPFKDIESCGFNLVFRLACDILSYMVGQKCHF